MRSLLALVPAVILSFSLIACSNDDSEPAPATSQTQSGLVAAGGVCSADSDCETGLYCFFAEAEQPESGIHTKGMPAPVDCTNSDCGKPSPAPTTTPAPAPAPTTTTSPVVNPPNNAVPSTGFCVAK